LANRIVIDDEIHRGKPVIRGTRVPVSRILGGLAGGMTKEEVVKEYEVSPEDVDAALLYAADVIEGEDTYSLPVPHEERNAVSR
jgi:uncharacterized protein (DUF433 family)